MVDLLLTGAGGQLGWEIARQCGTEVLSCQALDRRGLDITDAAAVARTVADLRPAAVVNAAAYTGVDRAEGERAAAFAVNRNGAAHLAEACAAVGSALIHISTDYVFDGTKVSAYGEEDPVAPLGVYGASKLAGEEAVRRLCPRHIILRTAWLYGVHGRNFVKTMLQLGRDRETLKVVDDQHGCPTAASDLADVVLTLVRRLRDGAVTDDGLGTFHCTGRGATTWCGFAREIFRLAAPVLGTTPRVEAVTTAQYPTPARRPANSVLDCSRLARVHGLALRPWRDALAEKVPEMLAAVSAAANSRATV